MRISNGETRECNRAINRERQRPADGDASLDRLAAFEEYIREARQLFFRKFVKNQLSESFSEVLERLASLAQELVSQPRETICISHSFTMKVLEVVARHPEVAMHPEKLLKYYDGSTKAYEHMEGFSLTMKQLNDLIAATASSKHKSTLK